MRLSLQAGRLDFQRVAEELTPHDINAWVAFSKIEPFGDERADMRAAFNSAYVGAAMGGKGDASPLLSYLEKMRRETVVTVSPDQAVAMLRAQVAKGG